MPYLLSTKIGKTGTSSYERKITELHFEIEKKAIELQDVVQTKEIALKEILLLGIRKSDIIKTISSLEKELEEKKNELNSLVERKENILASIKNETNKEKEKLEDTRKNLEFLTEKVNEFSSVASELDSFIKKEYQAKESYLKEQEKVNKLKEKYSNLLTETQKEKKEIEIQKEKLMKGKASMTDLFSKLSAYCYQVRQATIYLNKSLEERKVPLTYGLPPDKLTEIKFYE